MCYHRDSFEYNRVFKLTNMTNELKKEIAEFLREIPQSIPLHNSNGQFSYKNQILINKSQTILNKLI